MSKLNIPFLSSHKDKTFGAKIITIGQCINELSAIRFKSL